MCVLQLRMYRVLLFFRVLEYNLVVSLLTTTMVRNFVYIIYTAHWAGALRVQSTQECRRMHCMPHHALLPNQPQASPPRTQEPMRSSASQAAASSSSRHKSISQSRHGWACTQTCWPPGRQSSTGNELRVIFTMRL